MWQLCAQAAGPNRERERMAATFIGRGTSRTQRHEACSMANRPMTKTMQLGKRIELLLNTLRGERYVRRALLTELVDEFAALPAYRDAAHAARSVLGRLEALDDIQYEREISRVWDLACGRRSGLRLAVGGRTRGASPAARPATRAAR
jgi:hypothetical protein